MIRYFGILALGAILALGGCAGLKQFPETSKNYAAALPELDKEYHIALATVYEPDATADEKKQIRNAMIERRMAVIDVHFREFEKSLARDNASVDFGIATVGVGVGAAGSLVAETVSQILSAVSGGLAGAQAAYNKAVLYDQTLSALVAQMHAGRKAIAADIFQRWELSIEQYPLWVARRDVDAYQFAGSLPGAIMGTAADAKVKEEEADKILLKKITKDALSAKAFADRKGLRQLVDALDTAKAKTLVTDIQTDFPGIRDIVTAQYPDAVRTADTDGSKAKKLLRRLILLTAKETEDREKWQSALNAL